jgi:hypothetical protein
MYNFLLVYLMTVNSYTVVGSLSFSIFYVWMYVNLIFV